jgi:hypothetical protein
VLWTDADGQWRPVVEQLRGLMPELLTLGDYESATRTGPAIWLRCVIEPAVRADKFSGLDWPAHTVPVIYLPGGKKRAGLLRSKPNIKWAKDRGKEPERPKAEYPWLWGWDAKSIDFTGGKVFDGNRWNDCHYTNKTKQQAREKLAAKGAENRRSRTP